MLNESLEIKRPLMYSYDDLNNLRIELEQKIDKKLSVDIHNVYVKIIGGTFLLIIGLLSWFGIYFFTNHLEKHFEIENRLSYLESLQKKR